MFRRALVGYDGSKSAKAALESAVAMAEDWAIELTVLWVREPLPRHSDLLGEVVGEKEAADEYFKERCEEIKQVAQEHGVDIRCVARVGYPAEAIVRHASENGCDLIVIGHSNHSEWWGRLLGDTADRICDHAQCNVLVVKS